MCISLNRANYTKEKLDLVTLDMLTKTLRTWKIMRNFVIKAKREHNQQEKGTENFAEC